VGKPKPTSFRCFGNTPSLIWINATVLGDRRHVREDERRTHVASRFANRRRLAFPHIPKCCGRLPDSQDIPEAPGQER
jgi:hypothetical protein